MNFLMYISVLIFLSQDVFGLNKYSKEVNVKVKPKEVKNDKLKEYFEEDVNFHVRDHDKPFRMAKLNLLWSKAKVVSKSFSLVFISQVEPYFIITITVFFFNFQRLSEPKLKSFYSDLKLHDKEEIAYKHYIAAGNSDKEGLKEAELRKKLIGIEIFL